MSRNNAFDEVNSFRLTRNDDGQIELSDSFTQDAVKDSQEEEEPLHIDESTSLFSAANIEKFISGIHDFSYDGDLQSDIVDVVSIDMNNFDDIRTVPHTEVLRIDKLVHLIREHAKAVFCVNEHKRDEICRLPSTVPLPDKDVSGRKLYRERLELNTYPLEVRRRAIDDKVLSELKTRMKLYEISSEGSFSEKQYFFINFDGIDQNLVKLARHEISDLMDTLVEDYAQEVEMHDVMRVVLSFGGGTASDIIINRHSCIIIAYPIHCICLNNKLILVESSTLARTDNNILETAAEKVFQAMKYQRAMHLNKKIVEHLPTSDFKVGRKSDADQSEIELDEESSKDSRKSTRIDQFGAVPIASQFSLLCYDAIFLTLFKLHDNILNLLKGKAKRVVSNYNSRIYVSLHDQSLMSLIKAQLKKLLDTIDTKVTLIEKLLNDDIYMALMNLAETSDDDSIYRMTVNKKKTLSKFDERIRHASQPIELILHQHYLHYARLKRDAKNLWTTLESTEENQDLESMNVQTKVLVANTNMTVLGTAIGFGAFVTGAFGMNLDNNFVDWMDGTFLIVTMTTFVIIIIATRLTISALRASEVIPEESVFGAWLPF